MQNLPIMSKKCIIGQGEESSKFCYSLCTYVFYNQTFGFGQMWKICLPPNVENLASVYPWIIMLKKRAKAESRMHCKKLALINS